LASFRLLVNFILDRPTFQQVVF